MNDHEYKLTSREKIKLIRNVIIVILFDILILSFYVVMMYFYRKLDWVSIIASILFPAMFIPVLLYIIEYFKDLKTGVVEFICGRVEGTEEESGGDQPSSYYIVVNGSRYQIAFRKYLKIKINDYVTIRRAPFSNYVVDVLISNVNDVKKKEQVLCKLKYLDRGDIACFSGIDIAAWREFLNCLENKPMSALFYGDFPLVFNRAQINYINKKITNIDIDQEKHPKAYTAYSVLKEFFAACSIQKNGQALIE